jgi:hypothetical protein
MQPARPHTGSHVSIIGVRGVESKLQAEPSSEKYRGWYDDECVWPSLAYYRPPPSWERRGGRGGYSSVLTELRELVLDGGKLAAAHLLCCVLAVRELCAR